MEASLFKDNAIVVVAYNRLVPLQNLLYSLSQLTNPGGTKYDLIISIDNHGTSEIIDLANTFVWNHGGKKVIVHQEKLGLVKHFIWAGDRTKEYKNVIFLEDDLFVSPSLLTMSSRLVDFYNNDAKVAGCALYNPIICEFTRERFYQIYDGYDVYFLQHPYWGNIWFKDKWIEFKNYLKTYVPQLDLLPSNVAKWTKSFKKIFIQFLIEKDYYMVLPRVSLITNMGEAGLHGKVGLYCYQNVLDICDHNYRLCRLEESSSVYDAFFEIKANIIKRYNLPLQKYDFDVDLMGTRSSYSKTLVLTSKQTKKALIYFSSLMKPVEQSLLLHNKHDEGIALAETKDIVKQKKFYRERLFNDIKKNYPTPSLSAAVYLLYKTFCLIINKLFKGVKILLIAR